MQFICNYNVDRLSSLMLLLLAVLALELLGWLLFLGLLITIPAYLFLVILPMATPKINAAGVIDS
ncbi:hypothetical protein C8J57DRAFT_1503814 [Mycena rebaudengoi]|nr:hypothetical protein C8J57DRAFT_1503814 [Mycena rebaudengoi]